MKAVGAARDLIVARLVAGDEVIAALQGLAKKEAIPSASVTGLGAIREVTLAFYDRIAREYVEKRLTEDLEVASMVGNIAWLGDEPIVHLHGVVSRRDATTAAGHIMRAVVSVTLEVMLVIHPVRLARRADPDIGLNLLDLP
ncbi:MAG TPA: DUF296 domain-containing protein [Candidatus Polarisedimenticolia bacterium]